MIIFFSLEFILESSVVFISLEQPTHPKPSQTFVNLELELLIFLELIDSTLKYFYFSAFPALKYIYFSTIEVWTDVFLSDNRYQFLSFFD